MPDATIRDAEDAPAAGDLLTCALRIRRSTKESRSIDVVASTDAVDSYGEIVEQSWDLKRYLANPVVLFAHNSRELPIGTARDVKLEGGALVATLDFVSAEANPKAEQVWQLIQQGALRAVSVGFRSRTVRAEKRDGKEVYVLADNELHEISVVPIPANPEAVARARARALAAVPVIRGTAAPASKESHMADSKVAEPPVASLGTIQSFLPVAAELGVAAHSDDDARGKLIALAREGLDVRTALGTKSAAETATKLSAVCAEAAKVPGLEAAAKAHAEAEAKRAELERVRHLDALCAGKPELKAFRASLELHAKHDWDGFVKQYPVAAGTDPQLTALKAENAALRALAMGTPLARQAGESGAAPEPPSTPTPPRDHVAECRARAVELCKANPSLSMHDALLQASRELKVRS
jgi:HK97 family phage prohead protease